MSILQRAVHPLLTRSRALIRELRSRWSQRPSPRSPDRQVTPAVVRQGLLHPENGLEIAEGTQVRLTVDSGVLSGEQSGAALKRWWWTTQELFDTLVHRASLDMTLFVLALTIYLFTRLWALDSFPIYFFGDEAIQPVFAEQLIASHFRDAKNYLFPMYVEAAGLRWTPLLTMYFHALTLSLFGKSIFVARATSSVISVLAAFSVSLILKEIFKLRYWWIGALLLAVTPAWFLHSRTAFETVMTTTFYACFLLCYLLYRTRSPRYLYAAILFGAATFYTYSNGQLIIAAAGGLLFLSDLRYHLRNWRYLLVGIVLLGVLAYPLIIFRMNRPNAITEHLRMVDTYWLHSIPLQEKLSIFFEKYTYGLNPAYWFFPNEHDLPRHRMGGMGHLPTWSLPLVITGLGICLANFRSSPHRTVVLAAMAAPVGASLLEIGVTRVLPFVIPAILLAAIGLAWLLELITRRASYVLVSILTFTLLAGSSFLLLRTSLQQGPLWFSDYGLYGMQYGAKQLFEEALPDIWRQDPGVMINVSSSWANGADKFLSFYYDKEQLRQVRMNGIESYLFKKLSLEPNEVFVMTSSEYEKAAASTKFKSVNVERIIPYPDGTPGFYLARVAYADNVDAIFTAEKEARRQLIDGQVAIDGQLVDIRYSQIDMGEARLAFDNDLFTLMRGLEANPFILELIFAEPRTVSGLEADFGLMDIQITAYLYGGSQSQPLLYQAERKNNNDISLIHLDFGQNPLVVSRIRLEILNPLSGETANIHIREIHFLR